MKIKLICTGKNTEGFVAKGIETYSNRIIHYAPFEIIYAKPAKKLKTAAALLATQQESESVLRLITPSDYLVLLDEKGGMYSSKGFAGFLQKHMLVGNKPLVFAIGGAFGFSDHLYKRANAKISLSEMTFPHQLVRVLFLEQLYRAFTIIKNEPYHNE
jgi:23S rRNA (pseudouridine1915-N3)-methyltransferase